MRQVFGEWGVVTETKSASYGILSAPVANNIRGYLILCRDTFFDIRSITIGDILFNLVKRIISISKILFLTSNIVKSVLNNELVLARKNYFVKML